MGVLMNNKLTTYRVEYLCNGCNKAHAWGECTEEKELKNEPVAYVTGLNKFDSKMVDTVLKVGTPLYTHPAKTLTDEEIVSCIDESEPDTTDMIRFARAILRKAQEKCTK